MGRKDLKHKINNDNGIFYGASSSKGEVERSDEVYFAGRRENTWNSRSSYRGYGGRAQGRSNFSPRRNNKAENFRDAKRPRGPDIEEYRKKNMNPIGATGATLACSFCSSTFHYRRDCPDFSNLLKGASGNDDDERKNSDDGKPRYSWFMCYMTETAQTQPDKLQALVEECKGYAILDSGCPNTVCG